MSEQSVFSRDFCVRIYETVTTYRGHCTLEPKLPVCEGCRYAKGEDKHAISQECAKLATELKERAPK